MGKRERYIATENPVLLLNGLRLEMLLSGFCLILSPLGSQDGAHYRAACLPVGVQGSLEAQDPDSGHQQCTGPSQLC